jgi:hypothetical protein
MAIGGGGWPLLTSAHHVAQKDGKIDINHKGLIEMDCETKTVVGPKDAYFAVQHLTAIIDGNVSAPTHTLVSGGKVTRVDARRQGAAVVVLWVSTDMPSGRFNLTTSNTTATLDLTQPAVSFGDPVLVDLLSGAVFVVEQCGNRATSCTIPVYDAPMILTEREVVPISSMTSRELWVGL